MKLRSTSKNKCTRKRTSSREMFSNYIQDLFATSIELDVEFLSRLPFWFSIHDVLFRIMRKTNKIKECYILIKNSLSNYTDPKFIDQRPFLNATLHICLNKARQIRSQGNGGVSKAKIVQENYLILFEINDFQLFPFNIFDHYNKCFEFLNLLNKDNLQLKYHK